MKKLSREVEALRRMRAFESLSPDLQRFAEARASGLGLAEAAKAGGSRAKTSNARRVTGHRWEQKPEVQKALAELRARYAEPLDGEEISLLDATMRALRQLVDDGKHPTARARAVEISLKLAGKLGTPRSVHQHAHVHVEAPPEPEERERLLAIALRGRVVRCPGCGAEVPLDGDPDESGRLSSGVRESQPGEVRTVDHREVSGREEFEL